MRVFQLAGQLAGLAVYAAGLLGCGDDGGSKQLADAPSKPVDSAIVDAPDADAPIDASTMPADPRYKWVGAGSFTMVTPGTITGGDGVLTDNSVAGPMLYLPMAVGGGGTWESIAVRTIAPVAGIESHAVGGDPTAWQAQLTALPAASVITSIDFSPTASGYTYQNRGDIYGRYDSTGPTTALAQIVMGQTINNVVTTAIAPLDGGLIEVIGFYDTTTPQTIETSLVQGTPATLEADVAALAADGYIITAFGRTDRAVTSTDYAMVGTRTIGTHAARTTLVTSDDTTLATALAGGYAVVGTLWDGTAYRRVLER